MTMWNSLPHKRFSQTVHVCAAALMLTVGGTAMATADPSKAVPTTPAPATTTPATTTTTPATTTPATTATTTASSCTDVELDAARGTFESPGLGTVVGQPVYSALQSALTGKTLGSYAVNYPASLVEPSSVQQGNTDLVNHLTSQATACPQEEFILLGYSQGANVVDNSIGISSAGATVGGSSTATIPSAIQPKVAAILLFGNPIRALGKSVTGTYASRTDDFCATGDPICQPAGANAAAHLTYGTDASAAAAFAAARV
ncbi:cutinase family protein [Nocardia alni]|uniref:cutinase family protein n=1 Tax=Nocardia alni TaxID=2815723 RepID=UPI0020B24B7E|nr:cutinase family protein [Nocardia alni]